MDLRIIIGLLGSISLASTEMPVIKEVTTNRSSNISIHAIQMFKVVDWKFETLKTYFIYSFFIVIVVLMKICYFHVPKLSSYIPESCVLVITGIIFGVIIKFTDKHESLYFKLTPHFFFLILLPPIILEASYTLYHRNFLDNLLSILVFAVFGTLLNFLIIGTSLWGLSRFGAMQHLKLSLLHCLLFSSLIVAVDPVAVLAIFQDVGVNPDLYYLVFGESLLNDAVSVVLYEMMHEFAMMPEIGTRNILLGFISFFTVSLGGMLIGIVVGMISCLIIRFMEDESTLLLEPILLISMGYMSYLCGDVLGWSGVISMIACGLIQASYAFYSISDKSRLVLKRFVKILSAICEALIFLFLGVELVVGTLAWDTNFSLSCLFLCLITRFIVTFVLSGIINTIHISLRTIPLREKIIISYGGLRGAVAFSLAILVKPEVLPKTGISQEIIISTTLFIILFTIVVQGITVKPLVSVLQIAKETQPQKLSLLDELNESVFEATTSGIDSILGMCRRHYLFMLIERFNIKYMRPILQGRSSNSYAKMLSINEKINYAMVTGINDKPSTNALQKQLPNSYINLIALLSKKTKSINKRAVEMSPTRVYQRAMSDASAFNTSDQIDRLHPLLIRRSVISIGDDNPYDAAKIKTRLKEAKNNFFLYRDNQNHHRYSTIEIEYNEENPTGDKYF